MGFLKSKTMWFNVLSIAGIVFSGGAGLAISPMTATIGMAVVNMGLRIVTDKPLSAK
jgi:hypothetical protein